MERTPSVAVVYKTKGGSTKRVAEKIASNVGLHAELYELSDFLPMDPLNFEWLILGSPTYGLGELDFQWKKWLAQADFEYIRDLNIRVSLFTLGDQKWHGKTFAESLADFSLPFKNAGIQLHGRCHSSMFEFEKSRAVDKNGWFPGLVLDEQSEPDMTDSRIETWLSEIHQQKTTNEYHHELTCKRGNV